MDPFYQTMSGFCFTLLGLWWAVVQFRHEEWMDNPNDRRLAYSVHLSFLLPGVMSLIAMVSSEVKIIWQAAFTIAGLLGVGATIFFVTSTNLRKGHGWLVRRARWLVVILYALIVVVAIDPAVMQVTFGLTALQVEGILLSLLIFLGVSYAWDFMAEPKGSVAAPSSDSSKTNS